MIHLLDELDIQMLPEPLSPTATRIRVTAGVLCRNCGRRIEPVVMNGVMSPTAWRHLHKRLGGACFCDDSGDRAEPLVRDHVG
jgi:hypothetical protein